MAYNPDSELRGLGKRRITTVLKVAREGGPDRVHGAKILALWSKETNMQNICGGAIYNPETGKYTQAYFDHGLSQISEQWWPEWLRAHRGCAEKSFFGLYPHILFKPRLVPRLSDQTRYTATRLDTLIMSAEKADCLNPERVGVAGYNCGIYNAIIGEKEHSNPDHYTATGDYSYDICQIREPAIRRWLRKEGLT